MSVTEADFTGLLSLTPLNQVYWEALRAGHLDHQRCAACGKAWLPPREQCPGCLQESWVWETSKGRGRLISWVVYHVAPNPDFASKLPYNVALVELDEGPRLITNLVDLERGAPPRIEAPVELEIQEEGGLALARFRVS
jgi:uncharacterized OB-fold protein